MLLRSLFLLAALCASCAAPEPPAVRTATVERASFSRYDEAPCRLEARSGVEVHAERVGRVVELHAALGERVRRNQLLATLEVDGPTEAEVSSRAAASERRRADVRAALAALDANAAVQRAEEAALARARVEAQTAEEAFERARLLMADGLIARLEFEQRQADAREARQAVERAESDLQALHEAGAALAAAHDVALRRAQTADATLSRKPAGARRAAMVAPADGDLAALAVRVGDTVAPPAEDAPRAPLGIVADPASWAVVASPAPTGLRPGQPIEVLLGFAGGRPVEALVEAADAEEVTVALANPPEGMRLDAECLLRVRVETGATLAVPAEAVVEREGSVGVFVVEGEVARFQPVETGSNDGARVEIRAGLTVGESVVAGPSSVLERLEPGASVRIEDGGR